MMVLWIFLDCWSCRERYLKKNIIHWRLDLMHLCFNSHPKWSDTWLMILQTMVSVEVKKKKRGLKLMQVSSEGTFCSFTSCHCSSTQKIVFGKPEVVWDFGCPSSLQDLSSSKYINFSQRSADVTSAGSVSVIRQSDSRMCSNRRCCLCNKRSYPALYTVFWRPEHLKFLLTYISSEFSESPSTGHWGTAAGVQTVIAAVSE